MVRAAWRSRACTRSSELTPDRAPPAHQGGELIGRLYRGRYRRLLIPRYPFGIFYVVESNSIVVHAVLDLRQDPKKIRERFFVFDQIVRLMQRRDEQGGEGKSRGATTEFSGSLSFYIFRGRWSMLWGQRQQNRPFMANGSFKLSRRNRPRSSALGSWCARLKPHSGCFTAPTPLEQEQCVP